MKNDAVQTQMDPTTRQRAAGPTKQSVSFALISDVHAVSVVPES
jgi:hypothetical protein